MSLPEPAIRERNQRIQDMVAMMHTSASPQIRAFAADVTDLMKDYVRLQLASIMATGKLDLVQRMKGPDEPGN